MGKTHDEITDEVAQWIQRQHIFFVATAPLSLSGHVNCSPKGGDSFRIIDSHTVAYQDLTGSGIETIAHINENARIVIMFCAFDGPPRIVRLHGTAQVLQENNSEYASLSEKFRLHVGARAIIRISVSRISDSCGWSVPIMQFIADRDQLDEWSLAKGDHGLKTYRKMKNHTSIDGLPGCSA